MEAAALALALVAVADRAGLGYRAFWSAMLGVLGPTGLATAWAARRIYRARSRALGEG